MKGVIDFILDNWLPILIILVVIAVVLLAFFSNNDDSGSGGGNTHSTPGIGDMMGTGIPGGIDFDFTTPW